MYYYLLGFCYLLLTMFPNLILLGHFSGAPFLRRHKSHIVNKAPVYLSSVILDCCPQTPNVQSQTTSVFCCGSFRSQSFLGSHMLFCLLYIFPQTFVWPTRHSSHLLKESFSPNLNQGTLLHFKHITPIITLTTDLFLWLFV